MPPDPSLFSSLTPADLSRHPDVLIMDVRLAEDFAAGRLPGAVNNCVFEVAFAGRMADLAPDRGRAICVYGADEASLEGRVAVEKLLRAGYRDVRELEGGFAGWVAAGQTVQGDGPGQAAAPGNRDGRYSLDLVESRVEWTGRNLLNHHRGEIDLSSGWLDLRDGRLAGGEFVLALSSLRCTDLEGHPLHDVLIAHLASDDFFDVERYPEARFVITAAREIGVTGGSANLAVEGLLSIKDVTAPLGFSAAAGWTPDGKAAAQATLAFDRTIWNVLYGSGKFFRRLGGHLVNDLIEIRLRIVTA